MITQQPINTPFKESLSSEESFEITEKVNLDTKNDAHKEIQIDKLNLFFRLHKNAQCANGESNKIVLEKKSAVTA